MTGPAQDRQILHASAVAVAGRAVLVTGPSGAGKSSLCLRMLALGAQLVADDRTEVRRGGDGLLLAGCPQGAIRGLIEVRGLGLLRADPVEAPVALVLDLATPEPDRLPPRRTIKIMGVTLPLQQKPQTDAVAEALMLYLRGGRQE